MSKTTPVRWWRDDADRYKSRPLIGVCRSQPQPEWAVRVLAPDDPATARVLEWYTSQLPISSDATLSTELDRLDQWRRNKLRPSPIEEVFRALAITRRDAEAERAGNPIEEIRVGVDYGNDDTSHRVVIGRHRDNTFTVLRSATNDMEESMPTMMVSTQPERMAKLLTELWRDRVVGHVHDVMHSVYAIVEVNEDLAVHIRAVHNDPDNPTPPFHDQWVDPTLLTFD